METEAIEIIKLHVECSADRQPQYFFIGKRKIEAIKVLDRWLGEDHSYFKVQAEDGTYIIRLNSATGEWELTLFEHAMNRHGQLAIFERP